MLKKDLPEYKNMSCLNCGVRFHVKKSHLSIRKTCSHKCRDIYFKTSFLGKNNPNYKNSALRICENCNLSYEHYSKKRKFCSKKCSQLKLFNKWRVSGKYRKKRILKVYRCTICQKVVPRKIYRCSEHKVIALKYKFVAGNCSKCDSIIKVNLLNPLKEKLCIKCVFKGKRTGSGNSNWRGGLKSENKKIRDSKEYKDWRKSVFERDRYTCVWCGQYGGQLHADHIKPFSKFPGLRLNLNNGRTLCVPCHKKTDSFLSKALIKNRT